MSLSESLVRISLCLSTAAIAFLLGGTARAESYRPPSLVACQANAVSTAANGDCYSAEIERLEARLPPGSARWKSNMERSCNKQMQGNGTGGIGMAMGCMLDALAVRVGASRGAATPASDTPVPAAPRGAAPTFSDQVALVTWLLQHSGRDFDFSKDAATPTVFSPGLRSAIRASLARSRQVNEPPCGADGDIVLATQEFGPAENMRISAQQTATDRVTVTTSFDVVGYHRDRRFLTVNMDGIWKVENIEADGHSLRRLLACQH